MNFKNKAFLLAVFGFGLHLNTQAQITNDTTVQLYSPRTTRVFHEKAFFRGNYEELPVDTSLTNFASSLYWFSDTTFQQTLDNVGLATKPIFPRLPNRIGVRLGRNVYDTYGYYSDELAYFNTRSPYTKLEYIQGSLGEGIFEAEFSRNIKPWWNAGIAYHRVSSNKQIGSTVRRDPQVDNNGVKIYTHLQSTNNRYHLFANYLHMNHLLTESGGVRPEPGETRGDLFDFQSERTWLTQATARDVRHSFHIGQTYALLGDWVKLFYNFDERKQSNRFDDLSLADKYIGTGREKRLIFYPNEINQDSTQTRNRSIYHEVENTAGITGNQKLFFYSAYLKNRSAKVERLSLNTRRFNQTFVGGEAELKVNEKINTAVRAEYKLTNEYFAQAEVHFLFLGGQYTRMLYAPDLMQQEYFGNHRKWKNNFDNISGDRVAVWLQGKLWKNTGRLEIANLSLNNYVFYNQEQLPQQASETQRVSTITLDHKFNLGKLHLDNLAVYANTDAEFIRVPDWMVNSKLYYQGFILKKALYGQVGVEATFRSDYLADAYSPNLQQFYLQDQFRVENYLILDPFVSVDIKTINIFLKLAHANQGLSGPGYFTTPYYPGMRRSFIFGLKWMFFD